ncbi:hypothetical protein ES708_16539 [subsurface metagenome]
MINYTKGEWKLVQPASGQIEVLGLTGMVASIKLNSLIQPKEMLANAQLIASAPDLYEALKALTNDAQASPKINVWEIPYSTIQDAIKALAKAEGK